MVSHSLAVFVRGERGILGGRKQWHKLKYNCQQSSAISDKNKGDGSQLSKNYLKVEKTFDLACAGWLGLARQKE